DDRQDTEHHRDDAPAQRVGQADDPQRQPQGAILGLAFWIVGLPNALFWGVVTMVFGILPIVGSGLVWVPAALALQIGHRPGPAAQRVGQPDGAELHGQGAVLVLALWVAGLPIALFWGVVTMVFGILPIVGSGLVWVPAAIALLIGNRPGPAALITLVGLFVG